MGLDGLGPWPEQPLIPPAAAPLRNPVPAQALSGWQPQMGYFISKATFSCAVICLICYPFFRPHISHTHQTKVCLGGEAGGKEAEGDTEEAESGWGLALASRGANPRTRHEFRDLRGDWPVIAPLPQWSLGRQIFLCGRRQGWACHGHLTWPLGAASKRAPGGKIAQSLVSAVPPNSMVRLGAQPEECSLDGSKMSAEQPSLSQTWWDRENVMLKST